MFRRFLNDRGHYCLVVVLPVATPETSTDAEGTGAALKQWDIFLSTVVLLSDELQSNEDQQGSYRYETEAVLWEQVKNAKIPEP